MNSKTCTNPPATPARPLAYQPLKASDFEPILRPGAMDHTKYGSRQPDGSVKPYAKPVHGCVGFLKDKASNARD